MLVRLSALWSAPRTARPAPAHNGRPLFRPVLEGFEDRVVPAAPADVGPAALVAPAQAAAQNVIPIDITAINFDPLTGALTAVARVGNQVFNIPLNLGLNPNSPAGAECPILDLEIGAIHLDLLGLNVDTSDICLEITAQEGQGLLGDLLCDVAHLLDGGLSLADVLAGLTNTQLTDLLGGLTGLLDQVFDRITDRANVVGVGDSPGGTCDVLNLALGPIDLNLLGLAVELDDCANGPVTVDITAEPGPGKLLGNLLCGLSNLLDGNAADRAVDRLLDRIIGEIGKLI